MCHPTDSRAPGAPDPGEVASHGPIELTSADGTRFSAYQGTPAQARRGNVVLLPDVRGLHPFYEDLAQRFAEAGYHTVAIDYFGRTAGTGARDDDFEFRPHVDQVLPENVAADTAAASAWLNERHPAPTFTVGFCFGGSQSWRLSASDLDLAGCVGFYGKVERIADVLDDFSTPLLLLVAGADRATPVEEFHKLAEHFDQAGTAYEMHIYDGAPHSFFDRSFAEWQDACADAWRRILAFTDARS